MSERLKFEGRLAIKKTEEKELKIRIESNRDSLRESLDPFAKVEDLEESRISGLAVVLTSQIIEYNNIVAEIKAIKKALGKE